MARSRKPCQKACDRRAERSFFNQVSLLEMLKAIYRGNPPQWEDGQAPMQRLVTGLLRLHFPLAVGLFAKGQYNTVVMSARRIRHLEIPAQAPCVIEACAGREIPMRASLRVFPVHGTSFGRPIKRPDDGGHEHIPVFVGHVADRQIAYRENVDRRHRTGQQSKTNDDHDNRLSPHLASRMRFHRYLPQHSVHSILFNTP